MRAMVGGCCVCSDERGWKENPLVYCDGRGCSVAVHQACYGIISVPPGPWYCRKCESQERAARVRCELCPQKDGALKRTNCGGWCHVVCALYIPEACFQNVETMEPIVLKSVPHERFNKMCYICDEKKKDTTRNYSGACMQCSKAGCRLFFHVTCAQSQGLLCEVSGNKGDNVKYIAYCSSHYKKLKKDANTKIIPAFKPIPADNASPETLPAKQGNGSSRPVRERKTTRRSGFLISEPSSALTDPAGDGEVSPSTKDDAEVESVQTLTSKETPTAKTVFSVRTRSSKSGRSEDSSPAPVVVSSASESQPSSSKTAAPSENLFTAQCDSLLSSGRSAVVLGSAVVCKNSRNSRPSVIVANENGPSVTEGEQNGTNGFTGQSSLPSANLTLETTEGKQLYSKLQDRRGRPKRAAQSVGKKKRKSLSGDGKAGGSDKTGVEVIKEDGTCSQGELAATASTSGYPTISGTVFGGGPCFQSPISMSSFSSPAADKELLNGASAFAVPPPPRPQAKSIPSPASHESVDGDTENGRTPRSLMEFLEQQWDSTAQFVMEHSQQFDVSVVLSQLHELKTQNQQLEDQVKALVAHRDHLLTATCQLAIPFTSTPQRPAVSQEVVAADSDPSLMETEPPAGPKPLEPSSSLPDKATTTPGSKQETVKSMASPLSSQIPGLNVKQFSSVSTTQKLQETPGASPHLRLALSTPAKTADMLQDQT